MKNVRTNSYKRKNGTSLSNIPLTTISCAQSAGSLPDLVASTLPALSDIVSGSFLLSVEQLCSNDTRRDDAPGIFTTPEKLIPLNYNLYIIVYSYNQIIIEY